MLKLLVTSVPTVFNNLNTKTNASTIWNQYSLHPFQWLYCCDFYGKRLGNTYSAAKRSAEITVPCITKDPMESFPGEAGSKYIRAGLSITNCPVRRIPGEKGKQMKTTSEFDPAKLYPLATFNVIASQQNLENLVNGKYF